MPPAGQLIKAEKWWDDKAPPALALAYFLMATGDHDIPLGRSVVSLMAFMTAFIGVAGLGHVVNDLFDVDPDRVAGKVNTMQGRSAPQISVILLVLLCAAWLPWLILPANPWNLSLIGLQLLLLIAYAGPPLRLKTRPVPGVITDALYAYTIPALITWTTFNQLGGEPRPRPALLMALVSWSLCAGLRGILNHQYLDAENDSRSGLTTFATRYGRAATLNLLSRIVVPAEVVSFAALTLAVAVDLPWFVVGIGAFVGWRLFQLAYLRGEAVGLPWKVSRERAVALYGYELLGEFYRGWYPLFMLAALSLRTPAGLVLAAAHIVLFKNGLVSFFRHDVHGIPGGIAKMTKRLG